VVSGKCTFNAGGHQGLPGTPGTFVAIPGNCEHSFTVDEPDTHILNFYLPAGFEQILIGISHPAKRREPPPPELIGEMMPPPELVKKLSEDYGMTSMIEDPLIDGPDPARMLTKPTPGAKSFPFTANAASEDLVSYWALGGLWTILASGNQTGSYILMEQHLPKGVAANPHLHTSNEEVFYILDGRMTFLLGDRIQTARQGALIFVPRGTVHAVRVDSETAHVLNLHSPAGFERLADLIGTPTKEKSMPPNTFKAKEVDPAVEARLLNSIGLCNVALANPLA